MYFYYVGKGKEEDLPSESYNDSDFSEYEWGEGREYGEDMEKVKKTKTAQAVFTMTCLDFVLENINPLGFLHINV